MKLSKPKYIFVTGGVASSLGKGIISASIARLLQARGYSVTIQKLDPYINVDPGTLNPYEHGECYVTEDGAETGTAEKAGVGGAELHRQVLALAAGDGCGKRSRDAAAHQQREGDLQGGCQQTCQQ